MRLLLILCLLLVSCEKKASLTSFTGTAMTIDYKVLIGEDLTEEKALLIEKIIQDSFIEMDSVHNKWNPHSELSKLNRLHAYEKVLISTELYDLFKITDEIFRLTEGRFDPTVEPLQRLWKNRLAEDQIPTNTEIAALQHALGWTKIHFADGVFWKEHDETEIDMGGIAKGHLVDKLTEQLNQASFANVYVEWGGEIRAAGQHPSGRPWTIFISNLGNADPNQAVITLSLNNEAIATSGDYEQTWYHKETCYFHIIDPKSGHFLKKGTIASASIKAPSCALADGLATALLLFDTEGDAKEWIKKLNMPRVSCWVIVNNIL